MKHFSACFLFIAFIVKRTDIVRHFPAPLTLSLHAYLGRPPPRECVCARRNVFSGRRCHSEKHTPHSFDEFPLDGGYRCTLVHSRALAHRHTRTPAQQNVSKTLAARIVPLAGAVWLLFACICCCSMQWERRYGSCYVRAAQPPCASRLTLYCSCFASAVPFPPSAVLRFIRSLLLLLSHFLLSARVFFCLFSSRSALLADDVTFGVYKTQPCA